MTESSETLLADYRPDLPGLETYGLDRTMANSKDSLFLLDSSGKTLWKETGTSGGGGAAIKPIHNWDGTNAPMVLAFKRGSAQVWDGKNTMVYKLPMDGNAVVGDFGGDSKQEVLMYSKSTANIYGISQLDYDQPRPNPGHALRQPKEYYNYSRYLSGDVYAFDTIPGSTNPRSDAGVAGAGGTSGSGGTTGTGGTTDPGGSVPGGSTPTGGTGGTGPGGTGTGGTTAGGGPGGSAAAADAGAVATGGTRPAGGSTSTGGAIIQVGGTTSTGGVLNTGGTVAGSGGIATTGGGEASGGAVALGGTVDTGGIPGNAGTSGAAIAGATGTDSKGALGRAGGCSCRVAGQPSRSTALASLALLGLMMLRFLRRGRRCYARPIAAATSSRRLQREHPTHRRVGGILAPFLCAISVGMLFPACTSSGLGRKGSTTPDGSSHSDGGTGGTSGMGTGGATAGGTNGTGGGMSFGGFPASGGVTNTGGFTGSGGITSLGGIASLGGLASSGGATSTGGVVRTGGVTVSGGVTRTGGFTSAGGVTNSGGVASSGGVTSAGGINSSGGINNSGGVTATGGAPTAHFQMENLDRGMVAVTVASGVYVGWRMLGYEYDTTASNVAYNLYRDGTKIATVTDSANYLDASGTASSSYTVTAVIKGTEGPQSPAATPRAQNYLRTRAGTT
jgi:MYXO-CTERM domain-containing protein